MEHQVEMLMKNFRDPLLEIHCDRKLELSLVPWVVCQLVMLLVRFRDIHL